MEEMGEGAQRNDHADRGKGGVGDRAKNGEPQGRAVAHKGEVSAHGHVMIQSDGGEWNHAKDHGCDTGGDHPGWERAIDQLLHAGPTGEKRVSPETDRG